MPYRSKQISVRNFGSRRNYFAVVSGNEAYALSSRRLDGRVGLRIGIGYGRLGVDRSAEVDIRISVHNARNFGNYRLYLICIKHIRNNIEILIELEIEPVEVTALDGSRPVAANVKIFSSADCVGNFLFVNVTVYDFCGRHAVTSIDKLDGFRLVFTCKHTVFDKRVRACPE